MNVREPKYHVVMRQIGELIAQSETGSPLPTERQLAERFGTSRTTVRQALAALAGSGRVARTQGSGTFVAEPDPVYVRQLTSYTEDLRAQGRSPSSRFVDVSAGPAPAEIAAALGVPTGHEIHRVERVRLVDGEPLAVEVAHLRGELTDLAEQLRIHGSLYGVLRDVYGVCLAWCEDIVESGVAEPSEAALLGVEVGAPMLVIQRTAYDQADRPVEFTRGAFRGERFRFVARSSLSEAPAEPVR